MDAFLGEQETGESRAVSELCRHVCPTHQTSCMQPLAGHQTDLHVCSGGGSAHSFYSFSDGGWATHAARAR
jgi:hypothetical protein